MGTGVIGTQPSPDRRGGTLAAAVAATDTVLTFDHVVDFEEDEDNPNRWLVVADSMTPVQYVDVDEDAGTVTLAAAIGTAYEAGLFVTIWDPTVAGGGAPVIEYVAKVERDDDETSRPVSATIPHELVANSGVDMLVGARVEFDRADDDEVVVTRVLGREAFVDPDYVATPFFRAYLGSNKTIPHDTDTILDGWVVTDNTGFENPSAGHRLIYREGLYLIAGGLRWAASSAGRKASGPSVVRASTGASENLWRDGRPNTGAARESTAFAVPIRLYPGDQVRVVGWQNTGVNLDVLGAVPPELDLSFFSITWLGA